MAKWIVLVVCTLMALPWAAGAQNVDFKNPAELNKPNGYSHVVIVNHGRLILIAGQIGADKQGQVADNFAAQAKQAFANLRVALAAAGAAPNNLVKLNYFVVDLNHDKVMTLRELRDGFINKEHPPASVLTGVDALFREDVQIEMEAEAVIP